MRKGYMMLLIVCLAAIVLLVSCNGGSKRISRCGACNLGCAACTACTAIGCASSCMRSFASDTQDTGYYCIGELNGN